MTDFSKRCEILGELWMEYRDDEEFKDFIAYNDLGMPLAYTISTDLATATPKGELYVNETWDLFIDALSLDYNANYDSLDEMLELALENSEEEE